MEGKDHKRTSTKLPRSHIDIGLVHDRVLMVSSKYSPLVNRYEEL